LIMIPFRKVFCSPSKRRVATLFGRSMRPDYFSSRPAKLPFFFFSFCIHPAAPSSKDVQAVSPAERFPLKVVLRAPNFFRIGPCFGFLSPIPSSPCDPRLFMPEAPRIFDASLVFFSSDPPWPWMHFPLPILIFFDRHLLLQGA